MMECRSGTFLSCVKIPRPIHADAFALSLGFFLRSWGWATPRLAGLWGAAQQSLKKRRVMTVTYFYVIDQMSDQYSAKTRNNGKQVSLLLSSNTGGSHERNG